MRSQSFNANDEPLDIRVRQRRDVVADSGSAELPRPASQSVEERRKKLVVVVSAFAEERDDGSGVNDEFFFDDGASGWVISGVGHILTVLDDILRHRRLLNAHFEHLRVMICQLMWPFALDTTENLVAWSLNLVLRAHTKDAGEQRGTLDCDARYLDLTVTCNVNAGAKSSEQPYSQAFVNHIENSFHIFRALPHLDVPMSAQRPLLRRLQERLEHRRMFRNQRAVNAEQHATAIEDSVAILEVEGRVTLEV